MKRFLYALILMFGLALTACEKDTYNASKDGADRDNTAVNERDRASDAKTAGTQGQGKSDVELTAEIRSKVTDTKMSVNAQNSKIVTQNGKVTLRGPVKSQEEKDAIGRIATEVAGAGNVDNQLEIESN